VREAIYNAIASAISGVARPPDQQIDLLNTLARGPLPALTLTATARPAAKARSQTSQNLLARDAIDLIGSAIFAKVKECSNPDCTRLFVDHSRGFSRRWCGMAECGNRAKAADLPAAKEAAGRDSPLSARRGLLTKPLSLRLSRNL